MQTKELPQFIKVIPRIFQAIVLCLAIYLFFYTLNLVTANHPTIIIDIFRRFLSIVTKFHTVLSFVVEKSWKYLIFPSIKFLGIPIFTYVGICLITPSGLWRRILSFIAICVFPEVLNRLTKLNIREYSKS
ncbi:hypothetical protein V0288_22315, partial [Pannus brasiliensis CCIBt3594]